MTLVIQAINFLGAYLIMRYGLFSHAVASAQADRDYNDALISAIEDRTIIIEQKRLEKEEHWRTYQYQLAKNEPVSQLLQIRNAISAIPPIDVPTISDKTFTHVLTQSVEAIKKRGDLS